MYSFKPYKYSSHSWIISLVNPSSTVFDVGCSTGFIGKSLLNKKCSVYGIELDKISAKEAQKSYKQVIVGDIEKKNIKRYIQFFDYIIFGDVLEHTSNPGQILRKYRQYLKPDGKIIVSMGNIAHWTIRLSILLGIFNYTKKGILDSTHLSFYTQKSLIALIIKCGYKIKKVKYAPIPLPSVFPRLAHHPWFKLINMINYYITICWKNMFTFQFIVLASR